MRRILGFAYIRWVPCFLEEFEMSLVFYASKVRWFSPSRNMLPSSYSSCWQTFLRIIAWYTTRMILVCSLARAVPYFVWRQMRRHCTHADESGHSLMLLSLSQYTPPIRRVPRHLLRLSTTGPVSLLSITTPDWTNSVPTFALSA